MGFGYSGGIKRFDDIRNLPTTGTPNSRADRYEKGQLKQQRWYGTDGRAIRNRDYFHQNAHGNHFFPHDHLWNWTSHTPRDKNFVEPDYNIK